VSTSTNPLLNRLLSLHERELDDLEQQKHNLSERYHRLPEDVQTLADQIETQPELLIKSCVQVALNYRDLKWHDILNIVGLFTATLGRLEKAHEQAQPEGAE